MNRTSATFIPCHVARHKVQATVWCRSSLGSESPPVPRGTPAPETSNNLINITWEVKWEEETARRAASLVLLPAPDLQQRYRPGWDKSRRRATRIRCSRTVWALQDRSAAGTDPGEETQRWTVQVQLYKTQPSSTRAEMSCRLINQSHDYSLSFQLSLILVFILNWFKQDHVNNNVSFHLT